MNTFYIKCTYDISVGCDNDDGDGSRYSGFSHEVYSNHEFLISKEKPDNVDETYSTSLDKAYVVAVIYGDGGTFGRTDGYVQYFGAFCKEKAEEIISLIKNMKHEPKYYDKDLIPKFNENKEKLSNIIKELTGEKYCYFRWLGYFSSFEDIYLLCSDGSVKNYD